MANDKVYVRKYYKPITIGMFTAYAVLAYGAFILLFAGIYLFFVQDYQGANRWHSTLLVHGQPIVQFTVLEVIYFSAITTFTIGYGDITPLGWCKWVAVVEGFCGYLAPTLCVAVGLSILLNQQYDHMRRIRRQQADLLELVAQGWGPVALWPDRTANRVMLTLRHINGASQQMEMDYCCLDFTPWRSGYLSSQEEKALQKVEEWLQKRRK